MGLSLTGGGLTLTPSVITADITLGSGIDITGSATSVSSGFLNYVANAAGSFYWNTRSVLRSPSDGIVTLLNNAETGFTRLQLGGTTSSFPALARSSTTIQVGLADGSAWANLDAAMLRSRPDTALTAGGSTTMGFTASSSNQGIYFGSGAPTLSAAQGSLYIRSDGSSTSTRLYVNTNGTTGWTSVTTAA